MLNDDREKISAMKVAQREERARDAARAWGEYEAEQRATSAKTERLRELRLAKEAAIGDKRLKRQSAKQTPRKAGKK
jgi:hypothetical protein